MSNLKLKKIIFPWLILFCLLFSLLNLSGIMLKNSDIHPVELEYIKLAIKKETLAKNGVTIVITDLGKNKTIFGEDYIIEKKILNKWKTLKRKEEWESLRGYSVLTDTNKLVMSIDWTNSYGKLRKGKYRLLKKVDGKYISIEFSL